MAEVVSLTIGAVFAGDYKIEAPLAAGGMGAVYIAQQLSTGKRRALKVMHPQLVSNAELRARFEREARIGSHIDSENIVEVQAAGVDAPTGTPYIVMELLRGSDLSRHPMPIPIGQAREIMEQMCGAIGAAHTAGVVHRDLKPENIFLVQSKLTQAGVIVKVLDFGIAKLAASAGSTAAMGSPMWMAPEQTDRAAITSAADVWSLGLILYFMLTGKYFWRAANDEQATVAQLMREILMEPIAPASVRANEQGIPQLIPPGFDAWFGRCVNRDAKERFADAHQAWASLATVLGGGSAVVQVAVNSHHTPVHSRSAQPGVTPPPMTSTPAPVREKPSYAWIPIVSGVALVAVLGLGFAAWKLSNHDPDVTGIVHAQQVLGGKDEPKTETPKKEEPPTLAPAPVPIKNEAVPEKKDNEPAKQSEGVSQGERPVNQNGPPPKLPAKPADGAVIAALTAATPSAYRCVYRSVDVTVTFGSSGNVQSVGGGNGLNTEERSCMLRAFQSGAHVPAFSNPTYSIDTNVSNN